MFKCSLRLNMSFEDISFKLKKLQRVHKGIIKFGRFTEKYYISGILFNIYTKNIFIDEDNTEVLLIPIANWRFFVVLLCSIKAGVLLPFCLVFIIICSIYNNFKDLEKSYTLLDKNLRW